MALLRLGSRGPDVKGVQSRLNTRLSPSPKLSVDGVFGTQTDAAVKRFQQSQRLTVDGIVGPLTMKSLAAPPPGPAPANLQKFVSQLGTVGDFVSHVRQEEANSTNRGELLGKFGNFFTTASGARYLLVQGDDVGVIDFRHFFAAAAESYNSNQSRGGIGVALGGSPGQSVLLGVGNEMAQCFDEAVKRKRNSCFSLKTSVPTGSGPRLASLSRSARPKHPPLPSARCWSSSSTRVSR